MCLHAWWGTPVMLGNPTVYYRAKVINANIDRHTWVLSSEITWWWHIEFVGISQMMPEYHDYFFHWLVLWSFKYQHRIAHVNTLRVTLGKAYMHIRKTTGTRSCRYQSRGPDCLWKQRVNLSSKGQARDIVGESCFFRD